MLALSEKHYVFILQYAISFNSVISLGHTLLYDCENIIWPIVGEISIIENIQYTERSFQLIYKWNFHINSLFVFSLRCLFLLFQKCLIDLFASQDYGQRRSVHPCTPSLPRLHSIQDGPRQGPGIRGCSHRWRVPRHLGQSLTVFPMVFSRSWVSKEQLGNKMTPKPALPIAWRGVCFSWFCLSVDFQIVLMYLY